MDIAVLDLETSGVDEFHNSILEVCVKRITEKGIVLDTFSSKVKPIEGLEMDEDALKVNKYSLEEWKDASDIEDVLIKIKPLIEGTRLMGYNPSFDWSFLKVNYYTCNIIPPKLGDYRLFDLHSFARWFNLKGELGKMSLVNLTGFLDVVPTKDAHTAEGDVDRCIAIYKLLLNNYYLDRIPF